jgi:hypothetical protein
MLVCARALYNLYGQGQRNVACVVLRTLYTRFVLTGHIGMHTVVIAPSTTAAAATFSRAVGGWWWCCWWTFLQFYLLPGDLIFATSEVSKRNNSNNVAQTINNCKNTSRFTVSNRVAMGTIIVWKRDKKFHRIVAAAAAAVATGRRHRKPSSAEIIGTIILYALVRLFFSPLATSTRAPFTHDDFSWYRTRAAGSCKHNVTRARTPPVNRTIVCSLAHTHTYTCNIIFISYAHARTHARMPRAHSYLYG